MTSPWHATRTTAYVIDCEAYRLAAGEKVACSRLSAELRLDPCIALWTGADASLGQRLGLFGDLYCAGSVTSLRTINGDAFCNSLSGTITGRRNAVARCPEPSRAGGTPPPIWLSPGPR